jgi:hypothetical protein
MIMFILCVFFVPFSYWFLTRWELQLYVFLFTGYLLSEINSILSHLKLSDDDKSVDKFSDFIKKVFSK